MSESIVIEESTQAATAYSFPEEACESIHVPHGVLGRILVIEQPDGWRAGPCVELHDASLIAPPRSEHPALLSRSAAVIAACERIISWCSEQKESQSKKHRKQAEALQEWALNFEKGIPDGNAWNYGDAHAPERPRIEEGSAPDLSARTNSPGVSMEPVGDLYLSARNPRKLYPEESLIEMTESMRQHGFFPWKYIIARLNPCELGKYEIAAGHRRRICAERAGLTHIPVLIQEMTEEAFREILNCDNREGEPVHALHEADGWREWIAATGIAVAEIARRIGKGAGYVYKRIQISEKLIPAAREAYLEGRIQFGHAEQIARWDAKTQPRILQACEPPEWNPDAGVISTRDLAEWIKKNLNLDLSLAPFPLAHETLTPAGSCDACQHRVGNLPDFDPLQDLPNMCMQPACYAEKIEAFVEIAKAQLQAEHGYLLLLSERNNTSEPGVTPHSEWHRVPFDGTAPANAKTGLMINGPNIGHTLRVVVRERIPLEPAPEPEPPKAAAPEGPKPDPKKAAEEKAARDREALKQKREALAREKREQEARELLACESAVRIELLRAVLAKTTTTPKETIGYLLDTYLEAVLEDKGELAGVIEEQGVPYPTSRPDWSKATDAQVARLAAIVFLSDDFDDMALAHGAKRLEAAAKERGIDIAAVRKRATLEYAVESCGFDFAANSNRLEVGKNELAEIKFVSVEGKDRRVIGWTVYCDISLPVKGSEGYGQHGPLHNPATGGGWGDRAAAFEHVFQHIAKFIETVGTYPQATEATRTAAAEVRAWVERAQRGLQAKAALAAKPDARKASIGKLPPLGWPETTGNRAPTKTAKAAPAKAAAKPAPAKSAAPPSAKKAAPATAKKAAKAAAKKGGKR